MSYGPWDGDLELGKRGSPRDATRGTLAGVSSSASPSHREGGEKGSSSRAPPPPAKKQAVVELVNVMKTFPPAVRALRGVSARFDAEKVTVVLGANGSGK